MSEMRERSRVAARGFAISWVAALPVLAVGMMCFWAQRDAVGIVGQLLKLGALLVPLAYTVPAAVCEVTKGARPGPVGALLAAGRGLLLGLLGVALGSVMLFVEALRPESAFGFFADAFTDGHLIAAVVPSVLVIAAFAYAVWSDPASRRPVPLAVFGVFVVLGPVAWMWSASVAFEAMRYANADNSLLLAHAMALAGLVVCCAGTAALCLRRGR